MPQEPLHIDRSTAGDCTVLRLAGPILINNLFEFQSTLRADSGRVLLLDLSAVPYIDSAAVGCLVGAYVHRQKDGRQLGLVGVTDRVRNTLAIVHVESFFQFFDSLADAGKVTA